MNKTSIFCNFKTKYGAFTKYIIIIMAIRLLILLQLVIVYYSLLVLPRKTVKI